MKNWHTTLFGVLAATALVLAKSLPPEVGAVVESVAAVFVALTGIAAKDSD